MAKIIFDNNTDYDDVYRITELIYGDVAARGQACCDDHRINTALARVDAYLRAADLAKEATPEQTERYEQSVRIAYLVIYPFADNDYNP